MDRWNEHTMEMELESMDRQGEAMEIRLSSLGLTGAMLGEQEIERLHAEIARLREMVDVADHNERVALADLDELSTNVARLREALEAVEWWENEEFNWCPWCHSAQRYGHLESCVRQAALSDITSDWLVQHDQQVRQAEREHHAKAVCFGVHLGDPCVFCGTPWDEIEPGPCPGHIAPADDWLVRHDAEVRAQEQERCVSRSLAVVNAILEDLTDRRGLSQEWEHIETEIQVEIINAWKDICVAVLQETDDEV